jgi:uncharacterized protein
MNKKFLSAIRIYSIQFIIGIAIILAITSCSSSKNTSYKPLEKSLLWEIKSKNQIKPSYLFGTIHLIPSKDYFWTDKMEKAFQSCGLVVFELDMNEMNDMSKMLGLMQHLFMQGDTTLADLLTKSDYDKLAAKMQNLGLPLFMFERMKPFFLTTFLSDDFSSGNIQEGTMKSYELELTEKANRSGKTVSGLETIEFQASLFDKIPYKEQAKMLSQMLNEQSDENEDNSMNHLVELYKNQDIQRLYFYMQSEESGIETFQDDLVNSRNQQWIQPMIEKMKNQTVFFAVGAGHLPGEQGVIHLLRKQGFKVTPVR